MRVAQIATLSDDRVFVRTAGSKLVTMRRPYLNALLFLTLLALVAFAVLRGGDLQAQQKSKRLVLKDGSYQSVVKYEVQGDHVRYLSAERYEWEDIPGSLVDWEATKKYEADLSSGRLDTKLEETQEEEREKEEAKSLQIAPGLRLPGSGGVFLFDQYLGKPEVAEIMQNGSEVNEVTKGRNTARPTLNPLASTKQTFELRGAHAQVQSHVMQPVIYIGIDEGPLNDVPLSDRFRIVRTTMKSGARIVGNLKITATGKTSEQNTVIPAKVEKMETGEWVKVTPIGDLAPGEYAVVEMLGTNEMNLYVWDFGVNPNARANPNLLQPAEKAATNN